MRALGFCVSIAHAEFMARTIHRRWPAVAGGVRGHRERRARQALASLRAGRVRALFTVDLIQRGRRLPRGRYLLFLRPTESALVFLQQLGRGLRRHEGKDCVTVMDFIGRSHRKFRFDLRYRAVTGTTRTEVDEADRAGFPVSYQRAARCSSIGWPRRSSSRNLRGRSLLGDRRWSANCGL